MEMWKLSQTDVCDYGERQIMPRLMTCHDAPKIWLAQPLPVPTVPKTGRNLSNSSYRELDEEYCFLY